MKELSHVFDSKDAPGDCKCETVEKYVDFMRERRNFSQELGSFMTEWVRQEKILSSDKSLCHSNAALQNIVEDDDFYFSSYILLWTPLPYTSIR